jgi:superfamily II RNA helicase
MTESKSLADDLEATAQEGLREIVAELKKIERRLRAIHQSLPVLAEVETAPEVEDDKDVSTEIRSVIECVLTDSLGPAARDLETASCYGVKGRGKERE